MPVRGFYDGYPRGAEFGHRLLLSVWVGVDKGRRAHRDRDRVPQPPSVARGGRHAHIRGDTDDDHGPNVGLPEQPGQRTQAPGAGAIMRTFRTGQDESREAALFARPLGYDG